MSIENQGLVIVPKQEIRDMIREEISAVGKDNSEANTELKEKKQLGSMLTPLDELPNIFKVDRITISNWEKNKILPSRIKIGGKVYFYKQELEEFIMNRRK